jgi:hypothetical protein
LCGDKKLMRQSARLKTVIEPGTPQNLCGKMQSTRLKTVLEKDAEDEGKKKAIKGKPGGRVQG